jgi:hypothetical protein
VVSWKQEWLQDRGTTYREMWSPEDRNGLQKWVCGLLKRETAYRKENIVSRREERLTERECGL